MTVLLYFLTFIVYVCDSSSRATLQVYVFALLTSGMSKPFAIWHLLLDSLSEGECCEGGTRRCSK